MKRCEALSGGCVVLGGGGHAKVVLETLKLSRPRLKCVVVDQDCSLWGRQILGVSIVGGDADLGEWLSKGYLHFVVGVGGIGNNSLRRRLFDLAISCGLAPVSVVHPSAIVSSWAKIGDGVQLMASCVVNVGASLGNNSIINSGAVIEHDCVIEDHVHVATGARLAGNIRVGSSAHIGIGAVLKQGVTIGNGAIVGAGAVVVKDVPEHVTVIGVPARPLVKL
jgi:sugar O-acyltransferase (sialic acid O-acetyltransferase NeuD family)